MKLTMTNRNIGLHFIFLGKKYRLHDHRISFLSNIDLPLKILRATINASHVKSKTNNELLVQR